VARGEAVGVHWLRDDGLAACATAGPNGTYYMSGVTCELCRAIIELTIDLMIVEPEPPPGTLAALSGVSGELDYRPRIPEQW
jgi:hypothetical protein